MPSSKVWRAGPIRSGATVDGKGVNFALFSGARRQGRAVLFDRSGQHEEARIVLPEIHRRGVARLPAGRAPDQL